MNRRGFALLAVLWMVTLLAGAVSASLAAVRMGQRTAQNRIVLTRARWAAEACLAIAAERWSEGTLADTATVELGRTTQCTWRVDDPTARLNVKTADRAVLIRLFERAGLSPDSARLHADAVVKLRRTEEISDIGRLEMLPGFDPAVLPFLTADGPGVVNSAAAPAEVLGVLPGMTPEAVRYLVMRREAGRPTTSLDELASELSPVGRDVLLAHYADLVRTLAFRQTQLLLTAVGWVASYGEYPRAAIELLVVPLSERLAVLRRRMR